MKNTISPNYQIKLFQHSIPQDSTVSFEKGQSVGEYSTENQVRRSYLKVVSKERKQRKSLINVTIRGQHKRKNQTHVKMQSSSVCENRKEIIELKRVQKENVVSNTKQSVLFSQNRAIIVQLKEIKCKNKEKEEEKVKFHPRNRTIRQKLRLQGLANLEGKASLPKKQNEVLQKQNKVPIDYLVRMEMQDAQQDEEKASNPFIDY